MLRDILLEEMKLNPLVGGLSQATALRTLEKLLGEIVPMVERELGPLTSLGAPTPAAAAVAQ